MESSNKIEDRYRLDKEPIGVSRLGVHLATSIETDVAHAVKVIVKRDLAEGMDVEREISLTKSLHHPNVVRLCETFEDHLSHYLVMELCAGGELFDRVADAARLAEKQAAIVMRQMFLVIAYLHDQLICHRDLKPENFLFEVKGPIESTTLKLIDFGLSRRFELGQALTTVLGTALYVAPEVLARQYGPACDLWSLGVLMFCLLSGGFPFDAENASKVLKRVKKGKFKFDAESWESVTEDAQELITKLLERDVESRLTALQALDHVWVRDCAPDAHGDMDPSVLERLKALRVQNKRARDLQKQELAKGEGARVPT